MNKNPHQNQAWVHFVVVVVFILVLEYFLQTVRIVSIQGSDTEALAFHTDVHLHLCSSLGPSVFTVSCLAKRPHEERHIKHMDILQKVTLHKLGGMAICRGVVAYCEEFHRLQG